MMRFRLLEACSARAARRQHHIGGLLQRAIGREHHLPETSKLEVLGNVQGLRHAHQHAFVALRISLGRGRAAARRWEWTVPVPQLGDAANADLALSLVFSSIAHHAHHIAQADRIGIAAFKYEDTVRGGWVAVPTGS